MAFIDFEGKFCSKKGSKNLFSEYIEGTKRLKKEELFRSEHPKAAEIKIYAREAREKIKKKPARRAGFFFNFFEGDHPPDFAKNEKILHLKNFKY